MNIFKAILSKPGSRIWFIVTVVVIILFTVITILLMTTFYDIFVSVFGGKRAVYAEGMEAIYLADYDSKSKTLEAANLFNETICEEGFVLLKNDGDALPMKTPISDKNVKDAPKVSVFGKNSVNIAYGGSGSGGGSGGDSAKDIYDSLDAAGYKTNTALKEFYENTKLSGESRPSKPKGSNLDDGSTVSVGTYETPQSAYPDALKNSYAEYNDAAIILFTRMAGEGFDLPRNMKGINGAKSEEDHYLELDQNETDLLSAISGQNFGTVIVVINVGTSMELGFLDEDKYGIDAAIWTGFPGNSGMMALGRILNGEVNPSGRTVDTYAADFKSDPTFANFGDNNITGGDRYALKGAAEKDYLQEYYFVDYEESIFVGYRYYETRGADDSEWYDSNVIYPLGFGLSYTDFKWEIENDGGIENDIIDGSKNYTIKIKVTNEGNVSGRDVVQLYGHAPYSEGGIEKPHKVLLDFAKTDLIPAGEDCTVELTFNPYYLASYDYKDSNGNDFSGYELDAGNYELFISYNAHETAFAVPFSINENIIYKKDTTSGNKVENRYTYSETDAFFDSDYQLIEKNLLSRSDWTVMPQRRSTAEREIDNQFLATLADTAHNNPVDFTTKEMPLTEQKVIITFRDILADADGKYGFASYDDGRWELLLEQCKTADLLTMYNYGAFKSAEIQTIGKPLTNDTDGPAGFVNFMLNDGTYHDTCYYAAQIVVTATWSKMIAENFGKMVGNEGIWGADGKGNGMPYSGWYAPGANIHRSPFGGRNFEYGSEDGLLSGKMAAAQIKGCQSKGVYCFMKHFAVNDQETHRSSNGISVWLTEQSLRELYLKPFEIAIKEGGTRAIMSSFNRIGTRWTGGDYRLLTEILRNEWGFRGTVICDFTSGYYMNPKQMAYAGGDLNLNNQSQYEWTNFDANSVADVIVLRQCAKNMFYTVANSNAMNGEILWYSLPIWVILIIIIDCVIAAGLMVWGFFAIRSAYKRQK